jgi:hypothetical protein
MPMDDLIGWVCEMIVKSSDSLLPTEGLGSFKNISATVNCNWQHLLLKEPLSMRVDCPILWFGRSFSVYFNIAGPLLALFLQRFLQCADDVEDFRFSRF